MDEDAPAIVLLTQKPWILASLGFDNNNNGRIDPSEEAIEDCQKDNITHFYVGGTGLFDNNDRSCATGIGQYPFTWTFTNHQTGIDFLYDSAVIDRLNDQQLVVSKVLSLSNNDPIKFMLVYRH